MICSDLTNLLYFTLQINRTPSSKSSSNFSSSSSSMATLEKKSPSSSIKLLHQQSIQSNHSQHQSQLQQMYSQPMVHKKTFNSNNGDQIQMQTSTEQQSDNSSLNSIDLDPMGMFLNDSNIKDCVIMNSFILEGSTVYIDSDTGLESMSSSEQTSTITCNVNGQIIKQKMQQGSQDHRLSKSCSNCSNDGSQKSGNCDKIESVNGSEESHLKEVNGLTNEITKLKCDKLDLLRQNVVS